MKNDASLFTPAFKRVELAAMFAAGTLALLYGPRVVEVGALNVPIALAMVLLADFVSGATHWACDTWGSTSTPLLGPNIIRSFREHHTDQLGITRHSFLEANGGPAIGAIPFLLLGFGFEGVASVCFVWLAGWLFFTNQVHKWAHGTAPAPVRWLQRNGLLLSPEHHAAHHRSPYREAYCITVGWLNPVLDRVQFWDRLERAISATTGAVPRGA